MHANGHKDGDSMEEKVGRIVSEAKEKGKALLKEGMDAARQVFEEKARSVREKASELNGKTVDEVTEEAKLYVRLHPLKSLAIAAGVGFVLGYLMKPSRRD